MCAADETSSLGVVNVTLKGELHYIRINNIFLQAQRESNAGR